MDDMNGFIDTLSSLFYFCGGGDLSMDWSGKKMRNRKWIVGSGSDLCLIYLDCFVSFRVQWTGAGSGAAIL